MSESTKAVFLSYASQDAEAAKRICDALRAAGVEVWFDVEGGLETGDEWDAKIRRQIKECVLFLPLISANTQARDEGYFRIEWDLAAERARGIASGVPFILPIVIDDTKEPSALVPDRFRTVQWTRAAAGELAPAMVAKFAKLWSHRSGLAKHRATASPVAGPVANPDEPRPKAPVAKTPRLVAGLIGLLVLALAAYLIFRSRSSPEEINRVVAETQKPAVTATPANPKANPGERDQSDSPELKRAIALLDGLQVIPEDFRLAEEIAARELEKNPTDAETVMVMARVHSMWLLRGWDRSTARYQKAKSTAERALQLAPDEPEAHVALAIFYYTRNVELARALELAQRAVDLRPDEPRFHRMRDNCLYNLNVPATNVFLDLTEEKETPGLSEALASARRTVERFPRDALVRYELARHYRDLGRWADFERVNEEALALYPLANALVWKARARFALHGDLPGMKTVLDQVPARVRAIERTVFGYFLYAAFTGEVGVGLEALNGFTEPWMIDFDFRGPKALLVASLLEGAGKKELARVQYEVALTELKQSRARNPEDLANYINEAWILHGLGRAEEARAALGTFREGMARPNNMSPLGTWWFSTIPAHLLMGERAIALTLIREAVETRPEGRDTVRRRLALDPRLAAHRHDPEIAALLAEPAKSPAMNATIADDKSVAVLAFANLSDDKANEYFSDGISEELLNVLAKVPGLKVTARTSSFYFKGTNTPIPEIAQKLGVAYVVEGSVRKAGDKVRIFAQLIKAADGFHVWSDTFTRDLKDIFAVQDEIAGVVAQNLQIRLGTSGNASAPLASSVVNAAELEAYRLYWEAREAWNRRNPAGYDRAESLLNRAIELAPRMAKAHAALADVWELRGEWENLLGPFANRNSELARQIQRKVEEALAIDPNCAEAHASMGLIGWNSWQLESGERALRAAIRLNPNYASAHQWLGRNQMLQGKLNEALASFARAAELDPLSPRILDNYAWGLLHAGRHTEALALVDRALALQPDAPQPTSQKAWILAQLGRKAEAQALALRVPHGVWISSHFRALALGLIGTAEARARLEEMLQLQDRNAVTRFIALVALDRSEEALSTLDPEQLESTRVDLLLFDPIFDPLRSDARFLRALDRIGLSAAHDRAQEWRSKNRRTTQ